MRLSPQLGILLLLPLLAGEAGRTASLPRASDDWPRYAHDGALTARSPLAGNITKPRTAWSYSVAGRELLLEILPAQGDQRLQLTSNDPSPAKASLTVPMPVAPARDLDGSGTRRPMIESYHERWAKILPDIKGWQRVAWNHTWTDQKVCRLELFAYDQGFNQPRRVWQTDPAEDTIFQPLDLVYDIDSDGVQEICVAAHYRLMIFEGTTGRKETELRYHHSRPYGWFGVADVDGDNQMEFITIGDFQSHIDVLNYDRKKPESQRLSVRWRREIEQNIEERKKWPQVGPRPIADVTGDTRPEIVLNLFNDTGDDQWHAVVLNAATGLQLHDFPQRFVQGTADVDADGKAELFLLNTAGTLVPAFGTIELVSCNNPKSTVLWSEQDSSWAIADLPAMEAMWATTASQGMRQVLVARSPQNERPTFLVARQRASSEPPFLTTLLARRVGPDHKIQTVWQVAGLAGLLEFSALSAVDDTGGVGAVLRLRLPQHEAISLACDRATLRVVESRALGLSLSTPIAARLRPSGPVTVVTEGTTEEIVALTAPEAGADKPARLWRRPGRGMSDGHRRLGLIAADLDGDGGSEIVAASQDATGRALLTAYRYDGSRLWQTRFDSIPGATPIWNAGGLTFWWPGCFRTNGQVDLFVNTRRGLMHSDIGQLLDGLTGRIIWRHDKAAWNGQFNWGYAGIPPAVADLDRDGTDELISLYPVCFWVADGRTGLLKQGVELASRKKLPAWAAYGEPMIHHFSGGAHPGVLLDSQYILALLETNGAPLWHGTGRADFPTSPNDDNTEQTTIVKHALLDFDGDGLFEIASAGYGSNVRAIDPRNGKILWSLPAPTPTCHRVAAANIDGRRGDELLYVAGTKLLAVTGDRASGRILWVWEGPAPLSMPAIADVDNDKRAEIIVQSADGTVHCIDSD